MQADQEWRKEDLGHVSYWLGDLLQSLAPDIYLGQRRAPVTPGYFGYIADLVAEMLVSENVSAGTIKSLTNKKVYAEMTSSFPPPKVVRESDRDYSITGQFGGKNYLHTAFS